MKTWIVTLTIKDDGLNGDGSEGNYLDRQAIEEHISLNLDLPSGVELSNILATRKE